MYGNNYKPDLMEIDDYLAKAFTNSGNKRRHKNGLKPLIVVFALLLVVAIIGQVVR